MSVQPLIHLLEQLDQVHRNMLELAQLKKKAIVDNNVDSLIQLMNQETKGMKHIEQLEQQRMSAAYQFLQESGIKSQLNLNLTELSRLVFDIEDKKRLLEIQKQLSDTLTQLKQANDLNQKLIEQSLSFIDFSLDIMVGRPNQDVTYQHPSERGSQMGRPGLFDSRA
ncbi:flagellar protein FlgN [Paenibacillus sp. SAF-054]|uniref:flagellar protein FlgN n=1 Tax=unclassified Paenibacillus TaxID=185978 RepID=UPI003F7D72DD